MNMASAGFVKGSTPYVSDPELVSGAAKPYFSDPVMAEGAAKVTTMPPSVLEAAQAATKELLALLSNNVPESKNNPYPNSEDLSRPQLTPPTAMASGPEAGKTSSHKAGVLLASMMNLLAQSDIRKLAFNAHTAALRNAIEVANRAQLQENYERAVDAVTKGVAELEGLTKQLLASSEKIKAAEKTLADLRAALSAMRPDSPDFEEMSNAVAMLSAELESMQANYSQLSKQADSLKGELLKLQKIVDELFASCELAELILPEPVAQKDASNIARLLALMTSLGELVRTTGERKTETQKSLLKIQEAIRIRRMEIDAKKADEAEARASVMNKAGGCIGKLLAVVLIAVAVVAVAFTAGASLVLAGIALAVLLTDQVYTAATGNSFMEAALRPVMTWLQPLMQFVVEKITAALTKLGMSEQTAQITAMVVVAVVIAAAVILGTLIGVGGALASVASSVIGRLGHVMAKVMHKIINKIIPELIKKIVTRAMQQLSSSMSRLVDAVVQRLGLSTDVASKQIYSQNVGRAGAAVNFVKTTAEAGCDVGVQLANIDLAKAMGNIKVSIVELDLLNDMFAKLIESMRTTLANSNGFFSQASEAISRHNEVGVAVARSIRGARSA